MAHAEAAHIFAGRRAGADAALVDSRRAAARRISVDDWEVSRRALASGMGRGAGRHSAPVHQRGIARLPAGSWEGTKHGQRGAAVVGPDDDRGGLVCHLGWIPHPLAYIGSASLTGGYESRPAFRRARSSG